MSSLLLAKYWQILLTYWQNGLVYKSSLFFWRLRQFLSTLMALTVWNVIYTNQDALFGYPSNAMISYVFLIGILQSLILANTSQGVAYKIYSGEISGQLLKPIPIWHYLGIEDLADKLKNFFFVIIESILLWFIFRPELAWPGWDVLAVFAVWVVLGIILFFFISMLIASIGFWSPEVWGPRFIFFVLLDLVAGKLFPLDILPTAIQKLIFLTPLPYLSYAQIQLFVGRVSWDQIPLQTGVILGWTVVMGLITKLIWRHGLKDYAAAGN